ncbi:acyl-CoA dehydrogenase [Rhodococcus sp. SC4]|nr:acyl-CoA dehydrogenase [Rhodococcus sp. SC4]
MIRDPESFTEFLTTARRFVQKRCIPAEEATAEKDEIPTEIVDEMRRQGYFGWSIPEQYGGSGLTTEELVLAAMELSQCSPAFRARVGTNTGIGSETLVSDGTDEQRGRYLPALASGAMTGCFALTEPDAGSDATALRTRAVRDGSDWVINGSKCFITNAPIADLFTVFARTGEGKGSRGISAFLVERDNPGLVAAPAVHKMGQAGSPIGEVHLTDCRVPDSALIGGEEGVGFAAAMRTLTKQRIHLSALCIGPAIRLLADTMSYARERKQFGSPIADYQLVQAMIAESRTEIFAAQSMVLETARRRDAGLDVRTDSSMCKYFASEMCGRVADRAVQIHGGYGYVEGNGIARMYRDVRLFRIYEGTSQIHQLSIAKQSLTQSYPPAPGELLVPS